MARYDPLSYHNGSVWPHDTALAAAGLARYGFRAEAVTLLDALLDAADRFGRHLPELFTGLGRDEVDVPVDYPSSSVPQAWSAASPLLVLRAVLGLEPDLVHGRVELDPLLLPGMTEVCIEHVSLGPELAATITADGAGVTVDGLPSEMVVLRGDGSASA
jgi:glycogen debranching enzyme